MGGSKENCRIKRIKLLHKDHQKQRDWLQLPDDLTRLIIQKLPVIDRARMQFVCKSWKDLAMEKDIPLQPEFPWLMLPCFKSIPNKFPWSIVSDSYDLCDKKFRFFDTIKGEIYDFNVPKWVVEGGLCLSTCKGWLVIVKGTNYKPEIFLANPISSEIIKFPSITTIPSYNPPKFSVFISKIDLYFSEDKSTCTISAIVSNRKMLVTCKSGDEKWTIISEIQEESDGMFLDILSYQGMLYVLLDTMCLSKCQLPVQLILDASYDMETEVVEREYEYHVGKKRARVLDSRITNDQQRSNLLESNGEIFIIHTIYDVQEYEIFNDYNIIARKITRVFDKFDDPRVLRLPRTKNFRVFKMDQSDGMLSEDGMLFMGGMVGPSIYLSAKGFNGVKGNCIHFLDEINYARIGHFDPIVPRESGVYNFDDGKIIRCYPALDRMHWFAPHT